MDNFAPYNITKLDDACSKLQNACEYLAKQVDLQQQNENNNNNSNNELYDNTGVASTAIDTAYQENLEQACVKAHDSLTRVIAALDHMLEEKE